MGFGRFFGASRAGVSDTPGFRGVFGWGANFPKFRRKKLKILENLAVHVLLFWIVKDFETF